MSWMSRKWRFLTNKYHSEWFNTRRKALYSSAENWKDFHSFKSPKEWNCNWGNLEAKSRNTDGQTTNWITHIAQKVRSEVHRKSTFRKSSVSTSNPIFPIGTTKVANGCNRKLTGCWPEVKLIKQIRFNLLGTWPFIYLNFWGNWPKRLVRK